jgi:hypothetical protein
LALADFPILPKEPDSAPAVFDLYGERFHQHLVEKGRGPTVEEYRVAYYFALTQSVLLEEFQETVGQYIALSSEDAVLLGPFINHLKASLELH